MKKINLFKFKKRDKPDATQKENAGIKKEESRNESVKLHPKLNFQLIDIDAAFAN